LEQALSIHREIKYKQGEGSDLANLGVVYEKLGDMQQAKSHWEGTLKILEGDPIA
jgi:tetratricopeptide (TPR) repeat protein